MSEPFGETSEGPLAGSSAGADAPPASQLYSADPGGWDLVMLNFSDAPQAPPKPIPEQRTPAEDTPDPAPAEETAAGKAAGKGGRRNKRKARAKSGSEGGGAPAGAPRQSVLAGRRPSPLLLLSSVTLVGGAVVGLVPALLVGWALGYLSRQLTDFTRKFAILGIPLITMSATTVWFWGRAQGRWGEALQPGEQVGQVTWSAAPGALRVAAVLSALFLLGVTMRRAARTEG
ncbi:hypothetical protein [Kitasatospora sp. NPDC088351]|uniref:hypothetical protein n=1 Tax=unclassified Kitasatospora TaxID=2633591 RepID=UPI003445B037